MMQYHLDSRLIEEMTHEHHRSVLNTKKCWNEGTLLCLVLLKSIIYLCKNNGHGGINSQKAHDYKAYKKNLANQVSMQIQLHKTCVYSNVSIFLYLNIIHTCILILFLNSIKLSDQNFKPLMYVNPLVKKSINVIAKRKSIIMLC